MRRLVEMSVENPVLVNILMATIIIIGLFAFLDLPRELMSEVKFNWVFIITPYPGASSEEVEQLVTIPIEEEIQDIKDVREIISTSTEGSSFVMVKFETMSDDVFRTRLLDIKAEIDKVRDLPEEVDDKDIMVNSFDTTEMVPIVTINLGGPLSELEMRQIVTDLRRRVLRIDGVAKAELTGVHERQAWVELDPDALETHRVTPELVSMMLSLANRNVPAGKVIAGREEFLLRTIGRFQDAERVRNVIVRSMPGGDALKVGDIALVTDGFEERRTQVHLNGQSSVSISVAKRAQASTIDIIQDIRKLIKDVQPIMPAGVEIVLSGDTSIQIRDVMNVLRNNAFLGLVLVVIFLYLAIGARNALFVALGIPVTFLSTFIFMYYSGTSVNGNTLFALILVLGIVVDDAIIIIENCYRHYQMGKPLREAAVDGAAEVASPVLSATATTVAAFMPLMLMPGIMGRFLREIPIVVCLVLAASMVEAFIILPSHFAEWTSKVTKPAPTPAWLRSFSRWYNHVLARVLRRRGWIVVLLLVAFIGSFGLIPVVGVELFAGEEINIFQVFVEMPSGTSLSETNKVLTLIEQAAADLPEEEVTSIQGIAGLMRTESDWIFSSNVAECLVELVSRKEGRRPLDEIISDLRSRVQDIPGIQKLSFQKAQGGPPTGKAIEVRILGRDFEPLIELSKQMRKHLETIPGVVDIQDNWKSSKKEVRIVVDETAAARYGLNLGSIAGFVRMAFEGMISTTYRDGNDEVEVVVRYPRSFEKNMDTLKQLKVPGTDAMGNVAWVPLTAVARLEIVDSWPTIERFDQDRYILVSADIAPAFANQLMVINSQIQQYWDDELARRYPGYRIDMSGQFKEFEESLTALKRLFLIGVFIIFVILGGQFKSFSQPLIILATIPFAFIGAMIGLLVSGSPVSLIALYGLVALAGVAVNDAIVMIDFINKGRAAGIGKWSSLLRAGRLRLRPIFLTSLTTIGGLLPTALGLGGRSESWSPLANVIVWGMMGSTLMTLFIIPCIYRIIIDDIPGCWRRWRAKRRAKKEARASA